MSEDNPDSPDYNDTNLGAGAVYDSPEDKEIQRLQTRLATLTPKLKDAESAIENLRKEIERINNFREELRAKYHRLSDENAELKAIALRAREERIPCPICECVDAGLAAIEKAKHPQ